MGVLTTLWRELEARRDTSDSPGYFFGAGVTTCLGMMSEVERGLMPRSHLDRVVRDMSSVEAGGPEIDRYMIGFLSTCDPADRFMAPGLSESTLRERLGHVVTGVPQIQPSPSFPLPGKFTIKDGKEGEG